MSILSNLGVLDPLALHDSYHFEAHFHWAYFRDESCLADFFGQGFLIDFYQTSYAVFLYEQEDYKLPHYTGDISFSLDI